jgi:predicted ester cyclase
MSDTKSIISRFVEFINTASQILAQELVAPDARFYVPGQTEPLSGPEGYLTIIALMRSGFSDVQWKIEDLVAEGDTVAVRSR